MEVGETMLRDANIGRDDDESGPRMAERSLDLDGMVRELIEAIPGAAFIAAPDGAVVFANGSGRRMLAANRARTTSELASAIEKGGAAWEVKPIGGGAGAEHHLLVHRDDAARVAERLRAAVTQWKLSRRQADVLALVVDGHPNASIGMILGIATRTVEVHVSALLDRLQVENRSALVARVLSS